MHAQDIVAEINIQRSPGASPARIPECARR
jgi:hypothetical protein